MKRFILPAVVFLFLLTAFSPSAAGYLQYYGIEDTIHEDLSVRNVITLKFNESVPSLEYGLNFEISNLEVEADFESADCKIVNGNTISCDFVGIDNETNQLTLSFDTAGGVKKVDGKHQFSASYGFLPTKETFVLIRLPEYSIFAEQNASDSFFPRDGRIISDGRTIAVYWEMEDVEEENLQFAVSYLPPTQVPSTVIIALTVIVIVVMVGVVVYARRKQHPVDVIASVLNPDEKVAVDILKRNEGKALQKILVRESGFSKAKVSRLVKDMKERGIVDIEPVSGRENRIILSMGKKEEKKEEPAGGGGKGLRLRGT